MLTLGDVQAAADPVTLSYRYRVVCDAGYYGPGCSTSCLPRDDKFGHYACDNNGLRICDRGWTGQYCDRRTKHTHTHTHTHKRLTALFSGTTQVSRYQKGKTNLDFIEAIGGEWQWH